MNTFSAISLPEFAARFGELMEQRRKAKEWNLRFMARFNELFGPCTFTQQLALIKTARQMFEGELETEDLDVIVEETADIVFL